MGESTRLGLGLVTALLLACGGRSNLLGPDDGDDASVAPPSGAPGLDGGSLPPPADASPAIDLLAPCSGERNVLYYDVLAYPGSYAPGAKRFTNHDASWSTQVEPQLDILVISGSGDGGSFGMWTPPETPLLPGTYPQGPATWNAAVTFHPVFGGAGCLAESGVVTVVEMTTSKDDAGTTQLDSFVASFEIACRWDPTPIPVRGCIRYGKSP